jgi:tripartite-type tricarboxylate transporter receptor subunit TctC
MVKVCYLFLSVTGMTHIAWRLGEIMSRIVALLTALSLAIASECAHAQAPYPDRPVRLIVGFTPGSATDITARLFAQKFQDAWGVPVTVENVPGAGGSVGGDRVAKSAPDGTTFYWGANGALTINPTLQANPTYDVQRDLQPVARLLVMASILAVNNDVPAKSFAELMALAKAQPGKLSYASPGVGTPQHIAGELLKELARVDIVHVPYRGAVYTDVLSGRVTMTLQNMGTILPIVREGRLRGVAVTSLKRTPLMPDIPTIAESGFPNFEAISWFGLLAPAKTPAPIVARVYEQAVKVAAMPDVREKLAALGLDTSADAPEEFATIIKTDTAKWAKVIKDAGITAGN